MGWTGAGMLAELEMMCWLWAGADVLAGLELTSWLDWKERFGWPGANMLAGL
jgi:hypothetical protein